MSLTSFIKEKLKVNKEYVEVHTEKPENIKELRKIINDRIEEQGPGTLKEPVDLNDIDGWPCTRQCFHDLSEW